MTPDASSEILIAAAALLISILTAYAVSDRGADDLATPESFAAIDDVATRSAALFTELGKVLTNPRCVNCHPAGDRPRQGELGRTHQPPVERGTDGLGLPAMRCPICHQQANFDASRVPGHPHWHLAPSEMAWEGKTLAQICAQIKDRDRNGGRSLEEIAHHIGTDSFSWLGLGARVRPPPRPRHTTAGGCAGRGMGENRGGVSELNEG